LTPNANVAFTMATYGSVWNFWPFMLENTSTTAAKYALQDPDNIVMVGTLKGKGTMFRAVLGTEA